MTTVATPQDTARRASAPIVPVRVTERGLRHDLRGVKVVWQRELIRFGQDKIRILTALVQPVLFLFVLGTGLSSIANTGTKGVNLRTFMFPGVLAMATLFTAVFSAVTIVWDREFGFLREMLVAPVRRGAIIFGKCLGGATVATFQGLIVLALAGTVGVPYDPGLIVVLALMLFLLSFTLTALGLAMAARIQQMQAVMGIMQMFLLPLFFLSGSLYPLTDLPTWLNVLVHINPVTYAVHPIRSLVFDHLDVPAASLTRLNPDMTWWGWTVPVGVQLGVVLVLGLVFLQAAIWQFNKPE